MNREGTKNIRAKVKLDLFLCLLDTRVAVRAEFWPTAF